MLILTTARRGGQLTPASLQWLCLSAPNRGSGACALPNWLTRRGSAKGISGICRTLNMTRYPPQHGIRVYNKPVNLNLIDGERRALTASISDDIFALDLW
jgi:hypothetical protein